MRRRCVCGRVIRWRDSLCCDCLAQYGSDRDAWPEWLSFLVNDTQRELNVERNHREVSLDALLLEDDLDDRYPSEMPAPVSAAWNYIRRSMS